MDSLSGTYSSANNARLSAAGGKPALAEEVDRTPAENPEPPSAYCEVHLNDRLVYRTRTKQVTPLPYFNAVSERFLRDWRMAKIVFVVRDERDREHGPSEALSPSLAHSRSYTWLSHIVFEGRAQRPMSFHEVGRPLISIPACSLQMVPFEHRFGVGPNPDLLALQANRYSSTTKDFWLRSCNARNQKVRSDRSVQIDRTKHLSHDGDRV